MHLKQFNLEVNVPYCGCGEYDDFTTSTFLCLQPLAWLEIPRIGELLITSHIPCLAETYTELIVVSVRHEPFIINANKKKAPFIWVVTNLKSPPNSSSAAEIYATLMLNSESAQPFWECAGFS